MIRSLGILKWVGDDDFWKSFVLIGDTWLFEEIKWDLKNDEEVGRLCLGWHKVTRDRDMSESVFYWSRC